MTEGVILLYLIDDPRTVKVSVLRRLPPADASGWCTGAERDLQGHEASLVTAVAEEEFLEQAPSEASVHRVLQQNGLRARVWSRLATAETQEELNKPEEPETDKTFNSTRKIF